MTFPAHHSQHPACLPPSLLVSAIVARPPHKPHFWLTNRINAPAAINSAIRIPTTSEATQCRRSIGFDPAPSCAAPMPNQKRRLSIDTRRFVTSVGSANSDNRSSAFVSSRSLAVLVVRSQPLSAASLIAYSSCGLPDPPLFHSVRHRDRERKAASGAGSGDHEYPSRLSS